MQPHLGLRRYATSALLVALALSVSPSVASANGPEIGFDAWGIVPLESTSIQLVSESVTVVVGGQGPREARCEYALRNLTPQAQTIQMAFLVDLPDPEIPWYGEAMQRYHEAEVRVQCVTPRSAAGALPVRFEALDKARWGDVVTSPPDSLPVWEVAFGPSATVRLAITFMTQWSGGCDGNKCGFGVTYHARPARLWADSIRSASVRFEFDELAGLLLRCLPDSSGCLQISASPPGFNQFPWGFEWHLWNWEPQDDFTVSVKWVEPDVH